MQKRHPNERILAHAPAKLAGEIVRLPDFTLM